MTLLDLPMLLHEATSRAAFRKRLLPLVDTALPAQGTWEQADMVPSEAGALTAAPDVQDVAARLARSVAPHHTPEQRDTLALHIHAAAVRAIQERRERRGGHAADLHPIRRPDKLNPVDWLRINSTERKLINLIAASIIRGTVVDQEPLPELEPKQPKGDSLEQAMRDAGRQSYSLAKVAALELLNGNTALALEYAKAMQEQELRYADAQRFLTARPARLHTGRYHRGIVFRINVPRTVADTDPDGQPIQRVLFDPFYFTLIVLWSLDGVELEIGNATEIEARSGIDVGDSGWSDFIAWLHFQDRRLGGRGRGRPVQDMKTLIYREDRGVLQVRAHIRDKLPGVIRVLEALRRTLAPRPYNQLGNLSQFQEEELEWQDQDAAEGNG